MKKNILKIVGIFVLAICIYTLIIIVSYHYYHSDIIKDSSFKNNEFGDFVGGILNPLFTLLSSIAVIYLTYVISKKETDQSKQAIETQKRLTLNQMRQAALENLAKKTNFYVYEIDKLSIHSPKNKFTQKVYTALIKEEIEKEKESEDSKVWLIILFELENFINLEYLFLNLFNEEEFKEVHTSLRDITAQLVEEQRELKFIDSKTIGEYIRLQQKLIKIIGKYIYSEF